MPITNFPNGFANGVTIRGVPVTDTDPGNVFWVDSGSGSDQNKGTFSKPFKTIDYAIGKCTANNGDVLRVKAGHTEAVTTDGGIAFDVAGVTCIGHGSGGDRPTITVSTLAAATVTVSAANTTLHNILFLGNKNDLESCLEIAGDSCEVSACEFRESTAGMMQAILIGVADADSDYVYIHDCYFYMDEPGVTNVGDAAIEFAKDHDHVTISNNHIYGDFDDAGISVPAAGNASDFLVISGNYVENTATGAHAIEVTTGGTMNGGSITDNRLVSDASATLLEPHTLQCLGNIGNLGSTLSGDFPVPSYLVGERSARIVTNSVTFTAAAHEINTAVTLFTVTGEVMARCWGYVTTAIESDAGNNGTISVGVEDNVAVLLPAVIADETNFTAQDVFANATTTAQADVLETGGQYVLIANGEPIEIDILVEDFTAGVCEFFCEWYPVSSDGNVV